MTTTVLELQNITKRFGTLVANDDISLKLERGEILAFLGENGAGKTTLMNILFGHYIPDEGRVFIKGAEIPHGKPRAAIHAGVGMVHQHFTLAPNLTVLENIITGTESLWKLKSAHGTARTKITDIAKRFGLQVNPDARLGDLSVGEQQRVEILKALYNNADILILDEPTAVLTTQEAEGLFATLKEMARQGLSLIFISHKLHEVMSAADRVVVLRGGKLVAERKTHETSKEELAELMVGRRVSRPSRAAATPGKTMLEAQNVSVVEDGAMRLTNLDFHLRAGETLGIIGVSGNGQAALGRLVAGLSQPASGSLILFGQAVKKFDPRQFVAKGIGRIPEDRNAEGAIGDLTIWENAVLERIYEPKFSNGILVNRTAAREFTDRIIKDFDVRGGTPDSRIRLLSGGNMQKLILGRNLETAPRILIAAQPTRGLDEGAVAAIHARILEARSNGTAVLLISEDLDEVLGLADRVQAIVKGRLSPPIDSDEANAQKLGLMMAGEWQNTTAKGLN
ncbi:ABC transporter ATP-binding protein [Brucella gallinifaecis]|uniref:ABC transporter ATP-binding protein n=1 Tax=Brucella gallinifaecis TaxID=215590 RepID=A0A502BIV0_9HYPH|nr:ABC transporter ATP-binding protein [Brucella gallinifaecis]TPF74125.1 ABC transporter ATP-binding protein [Brucella gallinifaecis]